MSKTYLRFSAGSGLLSTTIQLRLGCPWSHVDFLLPDGGLLGALPGSGVQIRPSIGGESRFAIYELDVDNGWKYLATQIGKPYDYLAVLGLGLPIPRNWQAEDRWFCSEAIAASLLKSGCPIVNSEAWGITPRDLWLSPMLRRVV